MDNQDTRERLARARLAQITRQSARTAGLRREPGKLARLDLPFRCEVIFSPDSTDQERYQLFVAMRDWLEENAPRSWIEVVRESGEVVGYRALFSSVDYAVFFKLTFL